MKKLKLPHKKGRVRSLAHLWRFVAPYRWRLLPGALSLLVTTLATLTIPKQIQSIMDTALTTKDMDALNMAVVYLFAVIIILVVGIWVRILSIRYTGILVVADLRKALYRHILTLDTLFFENARTGELLSRMLADVAVLKESIATHVPFLVRGVFVTVGAFWALCLTSFSLTLVILSVLPVLIVVSVFLGRFWRRYSRAIQDKTAEVSTQIEESVSGLQTVQSFVQEMNEEVRLNVLIDQEVGLSRTLVLSTAGFFSFNVFAGFSMAAVVAWLGGTMVLEDTMSAGNLMAYFLYLGFLADGLSNLGHFWPALQSAAGATERVFEILEASPEIRSPRQYDVQRLQPASGGRILAFEGVSFQYPSRLEGHAVHDLNLRVSKGETLAIVGPSGAGKSTLFSLILRFYDPQAGSICLDGVPVSDLDLAELRQNMGLVAQETTIFSTSILENIRYGRPDATDAEVHAAAQAAHVDAFVQELPEGYATQVGERGARLSGGQRQRVAIARTILTNPSVLLLDEATSQLDAESEHYVHQAFEQLRQNRTTLVIAHRLATVRSADRIVVMDGGKIVAEGTHEALLEKSELYKRLATLQFMVE